jgi:proline iminopeptidase
MNCTKKNNPEMTHSYWHFDHPEDRYTGGIRMIPVQTKNGVVRVWTKRVGNNPKIKLLLVHGGPGGTHELFECFDGYLPAEGIEFIYYDQSGSYYSDPLPDSSLWNIDHYVDELEQVRTALGLDSSNFYLLGQSAGGIFAMEYALKYQQNMKGLIVSNMMASVPDYINYAATVLEPQLPQEVLNKIKKIEADEDYTNPEYEPFLVEHYYTKHLLRKPVAAWPESVTRAFNHLNKDIYIHMQGHSELGISGNATLKDWNIKNRMNEISVPALFIGGKYDTMDPAQMEWMSKEVKRGQFLYCPNGSHLSQYDDQENYFKGLVEFLKAH